jgi:hypothetical protein
MAWLEYAALRRVIEGIQPVRDATPIARAYARWESPPMPAWGFGPFQRCGFPTALERGDRSAGRTTGALTLHLRLSSSLTRAPWDP